MEVFEPFNNKKVRVTMKNRLSNALVSMFPFLLAAFFLVATINMWNT